ncbi:hypothetical protein MSG28_006050 [Choristoneura fumiferana]|uniref:Uncharacterized protein n=2 Tax=Choristoneura fumiferana TaxID=7141 RepID=A0ACC0JDD3_CHOFU|nr:hypothetical protein MSG28_006050 [Choristoneura fumiferana]
MWCGTARRCSRYQFECHSGGECIAVYNACDGVPQCSDGSDEAPELACPPPATRAPPPPPQPPQPPQPERDSNRLQARIQQRRRRRARRTSSATRAGCCRSRARRRRRSLMDGAWGGGYARLEWPEPDPRRAWPVPAAPAPQPQPRPDPDIPVYIPQKTMPELPLAYGGGQHTLRDAPKKGPPPPAPSPPSPSARPPPPDSLDKPSKEKFNDRVGTKVTSRGRLGGDARAGPVEHMARRCSRYQFECHSGGECIAVYNACDGVPQCSDGSDEAPELACPQPATRAPPPPPQPPSRPSRPAATARAGLQQAAGQDTTVMDGAWGGGYARLEWPEPDPRRAWPVPAAPAPQPQPRPDPDIPVYIPQKTMPELPLAYGGGQHTLRDAPKKGPPPPAPSPPSPSARPPPPDSLDKPSKEKQPAAVAAAASASAVATATAAAAADIEVRRVAGAARRPHLLSDERDGLSDRPPAAVLLLVLVL